jgi:hypothetical protein
MNNLAFLTLCAVFSGVIISVLRVSWTEKLIMYVGVGVLCAASLAALESFERRLYEVTQK